MSFDGSGFAYGSRTTIRIIIWLIGHLNIATLVYMSELHLQIMAVGVLLSLTVLGHLVWLYMRLLNMVVAIHH